MNQNFFDLGNEIKTYRLNTDSCKPEKLVFGYHPYWIGDAWQDYQWNLLTDLCYFSYEVDPSSGNPVTLNGWDTNPVIDSALANQTRVHLCITLLVVIPPFLTVQQPVISSFKIQSHRRKTDMRMSEPGF